jgi:hypothetical protein
MAWVTLGVCIGLVVLTLAVAICRPRTRPSRPPMPADYDEAMDDRMHFRDAYPDGTSTARWPALCDPDRPCGTRFDRGTGRAVYEPCNRHEGELPC